MATETKQPTPVEMTTEETARDPLKEQFEQLEELPDSQSDAAINGYLQILENNRGDEAALRIKEDSIYWCVTAI